MTNEEIDIRLSGVAEAMPDLVNDLDNGVAKELELLNMSMMAVFTMLGEIAKRLPEQPLTKREMIAAMILQGNLSEPSSADIARSIGDPKTFNQVMAMGAVNQADALIHELSNPAAKQS